MFPLKGTEALLLAPVFGFAFGWLLQRGRVTSYDTIVNQLRLRDFTVLKIIMTAYVYPTLGVPMDAHFKQTKADIVRVNAKAKLTKEGGITITQGKRQYEGQHARYEYIGLIAGVEHDVVSEAYVFVHGKNFVKFRLTYPAADAKAAAIRVEFFLSALTFPEK